VLLLIALLFSTTVGLTPDQERVIQELYVLTSGNTSSIAHVQVANSIHDTYTHYFLSGKYDKNAVARTGIPPKLVYDWFTQKRKQEKEAKRAEAQTAAKLNREPKSTATTTAEQGATRNKDDQFQRRQDRKKARLQKQQQQPQALPSTQGVAVSPRVPESSTATLLTNIQRQQETIMQALASMQRELRNQGEEIARIQGRSTLTPELQVCNVYQYCQEMHVSLLLHIDIWSFSLML
jgi:hypothetical protein